MKKFFVLGRDIGYSLSPKIFKELFKIFGDDATYSIADVPSCDKNIFRGLFGIFGDDATYSTADVPSIGKDIFRGADGFNVTKPYKTEIMPLLDRIVSDCGSVNTVTVADKTGYSTDGDGFLFDFERNFPGASNAPLLVVGCGGAARAVVSALVKHKADVRVIGRDEVKVAAFAQETDIKVFDRSFVPEGVISCVTGTFIPPVKPKFCYDLRYAGETLDLGCPSCNGLGMLIAQAIYSYRILLDKRFDNREVERLYLKLKEII